MAGAAIAGLAGLFAIAIVAGGEAAEGRLTLGAGTSTANSGLLDHLLSTFTKRTGIAVRVVIAGTGALLKFAERGDVDALLVHDPEAEERFVAAGFGIARRRVMASRFLIVGPVADPAGAGTADDAAAALGAIARARAPFVSRGDDSGTHKAELRLWAAAGIDPKAASAGWYLESGSGMGATLNVAASRNAYTLTESGTWTSFGNRGHLAVLVADDPRLNNPYAVIVVSPARHPYVNADDAGAFADWLTSPEGQRAIADFAVAGEHPFEPEAD